MEHHLIPFTYECEKDFEDINMAFSKKHVEARKEWLMGFVPGTYLDHDAASISYSDFINKELILFSMADNVRSIPSIMDGLKPGQRKVLFACFKRKLKDEIKVAQLAGYVSEHSAYHHGEQSLAGTIVGMAQKFVGTNNLNLLLPIGQFGTRLAGGKDAASSRYIFTSLSPLARKVFHAADDDLLDQLEDDGQMIEPQFYAPVLPMVLVNGSDGIGTGWSSQIPNFNPRDLVNALIAMIDGQEPGELLPWYDGFKGEIVPKGQDKYAVRGKIEKIDDNTLEISELPIRTWTQPYKEFLESLAADDAKKPARIADFSQHHTDTTVRFTVTMTNEQMKDAEDKGLYKFFKLESSLSTSNMVLFDPQGRIKKYESVQDILRDFFDVRLRLYQKRKGLLADRITTEYKRMDNKVRFILEVISGALVINNRKKSEILTDLRARGYAPFPKKQARRAKTAGDIDAEAADSGDDEAASAAEAQAASDFDYLLSMPMWNLTMERVNKLTEERNAIEAELNILLDKTPQDLWREDLSAFVETLAEIEAAEAEEELNVSTIVESNLKKTKKKKTTRKKAPAKPKSKSATTAAKKGKKTAKSTTTDDDDDDDDFVIDGGGGGSDDEWMPAGGVKVAKTKRATTRASKDKQPAKPKAKAAAAKAKSKEEENEDDEVVIDDDDDDGDDDEGEHSGGLAERLKRRNNVAAAVAEPGDSKQTATKKSTTKATKVKRGGRKVAAISSDDDDDDDDVENDEKDDEWKADGDEDEDEDEEDNMELAKLASQSKARGGRGRASGRAAAAKAKRTFAASRSASPESDEDDDGDFDAGSAASAAAEDESDWEPTPKKPARGRKPKATTKATTKAKPKAKAPAKRGAAAAKKAVQSQLDTSSSDTSVFDFDASSTSNTSSALAKGAAAKTKKKEQKPKAAAKRTTKGTARRRRGKKVEEDSDVDDLDIDEIVDDDDAEEDDWMPDGGIVAAKSKSKPAAKKAKTTKAAATKGKAKGKAKAAAKTTKRTTGRRQRIVEDEDSDDEQGEEEEEQQQQPAGGRQRRSRRARKQVNYAEMEAGSDGEQQDAGDASEDEQRAVNAFAESDSDFDPDDSTFAP